MPTLRNASSKSFGDLGREKSREFSAEEMNSPEVKRALKNGILVQPRDQPAPPAQEQQTPQKRR
jgi:hypothetical protein